MELFKIIKKTFDKVLADSKEESKNIVSKEAERIDNALLSKVNIGDYFITEDISLESHPTIDLDFIEWNILRHVFTKGVAAKINGHLSYITDDDEIVNSSYGKKLFHNEEKLWISNFGSEGVVAIYNIEVSSAIEAAREMFRGLDAKYISIKNIYYNFLNYYGMFYGNNELRYLDFKLPTDGTIYNYYYYSCKNLEHTNYNIELPNATSVGWMFYQNYQLGKNGEHLSFKAPNLTSSATSLFESCEQLKFVDTIELKNWEYANRLFFGCEQLESIKEFVTTPEEKVNLSLAFNYCENLIECPKIDGLLYTISFTYCRKLKSIPLMRMHSDGYVSAFDGFRGCESLKDVGGFYGYKSSYGLQLGDSPLLSKESCINIFENVATLTVGAQILLHHEAYARLTEEDIAIAVNKGWTVQSA